MAPRDQRPTNVAYYWRNRARELRRVRSRQAATRDFLRRRREQPCADCGRKYLPHQMDFDHRESGTKSFRLTEGRAMLMSRERLEAEVAKCDIVCANCHRSRTYHRGIARAERVQEERSQELRRKRRNWRYQARMLRGLKRRPCADCGERHRPHVMDFDHRDPSQKGSTISRMIGRAGTARIIAEVAKCDIVCANCHRDRTYRRRAASSSERE